MIVKHEFSYFKICICFRTEQLVAIIIIIIIIIYNLYRGKAPVTGSDFQGGPLRVKFCQINISDYF